MLDTKKLGTILTSCPPEVFLVELEQHVEPHPVLLEGDGVVGGRVGGDARAQEEPHPLLGRGHREGLLLLGGHGGLLILQDGELVLLQGGDGWWLVLPPLPPAARLDAACTSQVVFTIISILE